MGGPLTVSWRTPADGAADTGRHWPAPDAPALAPVEDARAAARPFDSGVPVRSRPLVSVALPVKNGLPHLRDAVEGLCRQTYRYFELIVQDGMSTDGSLEYLHGLRLPFPVRLVSQRDGSLVAGYNRALDRCTGDLVVAAACDEVLDDDALERYVSWYDEHPRAIFIYGGSRIVDASGTVMEFQPLPFGLIDYVHHRMCPTTAGAFNRRLLGQELRLDESLRTVPDFELIVRLALRFGEDRLVCKEAITMTARGDRASMSFRPEAYTQFARDKRTVIERLVAGELCAAFLDFLRRELLSNMHALFAEQAYGLAGDGPAFRRHMSAAVATMPGQQRIARVAGISGQTLAQPAAPKNVWPLRTPPGPLATVRRVGPDAIRLEPLWLAAGVTVEHASGGVRVRTAADPWSYAAVASIDLDGLDLGAAWYCLKVTVAEASGSPMLSLRDAAQNVLKSETAVPAEPYARELFFELQDPRYAELLLRNGAGAGPSFLVIRGIEVVIVLPSQQQAAQ